jgi:hypothetical protein
MAKFYMLQVAWLVQMVEIKNISLMAIIQIINQISNYYQVFESAYYGSMAF